MPVLRPRYVPPLPMAEIRGGRPVRWLHPFRLALAANALELGGGTVFFNPCHYTLSAVGGTVTSGTFRHKGVRRRFGNWCLWVVRYSFDGATLSGRLKVTPGTAPLNAGDSTWTTGKRLESRPSGRRYTGELTFLEQVDTGSYTLPATTEDVTYTLTLTLDTSGSTDITILSVACYELDRRYLPSGAYGVDIAPFGARQPVFAGTTDAMGAAVRQIAGACDRVKGAGNFRWLWGISDPGGVMSSGSGFWADALNTRVRIHPRRTLRGAPDQVGIDNDLARTGWTVTPVTVAAYGRNSATTGGALRVTGDYGTVDLSGWPIGSDGWVTDTFLALCESTISDLTGSQSDNGGMQKGLAAGADTVAEYEDRASLREDPIRFQIEGKPAAEAPSNTLTLYSVQMVDKYVPS